MARIIPKDDNHFFSFILPQQKTFLLGGTTKEETQEENNFVVTSIPNHLQLVVQVLANSNSRNISDFEDKAPTIPIHFINIHD